MDTSAREALATFVGGQGDVLIAYENEAIFAPSRRASRSSYVIPDQTILIENPVAVVTESANARDRRPPSWTSCYTPEAQRVFGQKGYRPMVDEVLAEFDYPTPTDALHHRRPGRLGRGPATFFDPDTGIVAEISAAAERGDLITLARRPAAPTRSGARKR